MPRPTRTTLTSSTLATSTVAALVASLVVALPSSAAQASASRVRSAGSGPVTLVVVGEDLGAAKAALLAHGGEITFELPALAIATAEAPKSAVAAVRAADGVLQVVADRVVRQASHDEDEDQEEAEEDAREAEEDRLEDEQKAREEAEKEREEAEKEREKAEKKRAKEAEKAEKKRAKEAEKAEKDAEKKRSSKDDSKKQKDPEAPKDRKDDEAPLAEDAIEPLDDTTSEPPAHPTDGGTGAPTIEDTPTSTPSPPGRKTGWDDPAEVAEPTVPYDPVTDAGSLFNVARAVGADTLWAAGATGAGVDVAVIDTGVMRNELLPAENLLAGGSFGSRPGAAGPSTLDHDGHGTHIASIIAGRSSDPSLLGTAEGFTGIAPGARVVAVKASDDDGSASLRQVLAAIDWVITNRDTDGRNIRVMNLSLATERADRPMHDVLAHAVTMAWDAGIVVVAAAGNEGEGSPLTSPAYEPRIISVGALHHMGTESPSDDVPADFSAGDASGRERPDFWAPGLSMAAAMAPDSAVSRDPNAHHLSDTMVRGSGTSQATAVVSGAAALLLSANPALTPDQVAAALHATATSIAARGTVIPAARLDLAAAAAMSPSADAPSAITEIVAGWSASDRAGLASEAGGASMLEEIEAQTVGARWVGARWVGARWVGARWVGARWVGASWAGGGWD